MKVVAETVDRRRCARRFRRRTTVAALALSRPRERRRRSRRLIRRTQNPTSPLPFRPRISPRIVGRRDLEPQPLDDLPRRAHLRGIRLGELAGSEPQAVLEPDAHVAAHRRRLRGDRQLVAAGAEHAPAVLVAEEPVGRALHVHDVLGMRADAAEDAEHALDEQRRLHDAAIEEMLGRVQVADVVALDLEARAVRRARGQDVLDVLERVLEDAVVGRLEILPLPVDA